MAPARIVKSGSEHRAEIKVSDDQVLLERKPATDSVSVLIIDGALTIKDQLILAAHGVDVCQHHGAIRSPRAEHALA